MARARNIKPSFFTDDELGDLPPLARLLFIGMWTLADYKGEFEYRSKRIKIQLLPFDDCDVDSLAISLDKSGFIRFYSDGAKTYCRVKNFVRHQNPHKNEREKGSDVPPYSEEMRQVVDISTLAINRDKNGTARDKNQTAPADSPFLIPEQTPPPAREHRDPVDPKSIDTVPETSPPETIFDQHPMTAEWEPNPDDLNSAVVGTGLTQPEIDQTLPAFRAHYRGKPHELRTEHAWCLKLVEWTLKDRHGGRKGRSRDSPAANRSQALSDHNIAVLRAVGEQIEREERSRGFS